MVKPTFFIYDLETSGVNPRQARIMQFAGVRVDLDLNEIEQPHDYLIKMTDDTLPDPEAVLITGITPQKTIAEGYTEAEFLQIFNSQISLPGTIFMGYNTVRFDDEFMRFMLYRNFYDPYEWQYKDNRSRWDLLDVVRMTRALRPDGLKWPVDSSGKPTNRLELLTDINGLDHTQAHEALSDVRAVIALARLIRNKQPKLFDYLLKMRAKKPVSQLVQSDQPFVYSSGRYPSEFEKTTVVVNLGDLPKGQGSWVYDLRHDPQPFIDMSPADLAEIWQYNPDRSALRLPVKALRYNRCPAVAPLSVLDAASSKRLQLDKAVISSNHKKLLAIRAELHEKIRQAAEILDKKLQTSLVSQASEVDTRLYDGFVPESDKTKMSVVRASDQTDLTDLDIKFSDDRLNSLLPLYKARNFPATLTADEQAAWEKFRHQRLMSGGSSSRLAKFATRLNELASQPGLSAEKQYIIEELQLYAQTIAPVDLS